MKRDLIKEIRYGLRNSRFLILGAFFLFFAVMTPIMTKFVLPMILTSQFPGMTDELMAEMIDMTQAGALRSYMGDIFELGSLIIAFTLCGLLAQEIRDNTLVIPLCTGRRISSVVGAKMIVFGSTLLIIPAIALTVCYAYAGALFAFDISLMSVISSGLLQGTYMVFLLSCLFFFGSLIKKPIATGLLSLALAYGMQLVAGLFDLHGYLPSGLLQEAMLLSEKSFASIILPLLVTLLIIAILLSLTLLRLGHMEWNERTS